MWVMATAQVPTIVSLGDLALDVFVRPDQAAVHGSDVTGVVRVLAGGSAANFAIWTRRLGADSAFIGAIGDDYPGAFLRADLEREGCIAHLVRVQAPTAAIAVFVDADGERTMISDRAAATLLDPTMIAPHMLPHGCRLHLPAYSLFVEPLSRAALHAAMVCRAGGGSIGLDLSSVGPLRAYGRDRFLTVLRQLAPDVLFANAEEAAFLCDQDDAEAGSLLLQQYAPTVVWKLGAAGALARGEVVAQIGGCLLYTSPSPRD